MYVCMYVMYVCMYIFMFVCIVYMYAYIHIYVSACIFANTNLNILRVWMFSTYDVLYIIYNIITEYGIDIYEQNSEDLCASK